MTVLQVAIVVGPCLLFVYLGYRIGLARADQAYHDGYEDGQREAL